MTDNGEDVPYEVTLDRARRAVGRLSVLMLVHLGPEMAVRVLLDDAYDTARITGLGAKAMTELLAEAAHVAKERA